MRPSWDQYFMEMAMVTAKRSTCLRRQVGAVIVRDNRLLSSGYNGVPKGLPHCSEVGCLREQMNVPSGERHELCRGLHAEQNSLIQAAVFGVSVSGGTVYCNTKPCSICTKMLINAEIKRIVFNAANDYSDPLTEELLRHTGIELVKFKI